MKKLLSGLLILVIIMGLMLTACAKDEVPDETVPETEAETPTEPEVKPTEPDEPDEPAEPIKAFFVGPMPGGAAWGQAEKGFLQACEDLGWEGQYLAPLSHNSNPEMVDLVESAVTNGAKVLAVAVNDPEMFSDALDRARKEGVTIIAVTAHDPERCDAQIGTDPATIGVEAAKALVKAIDGKKIFVATMQTALDNPIQNLAREAFEKTLLELASDAVVVDNLVCDSDASIASSNIAALKLAKPDLNSMMSIDSYAGLGAASWVEEAGLKGEFIVMGMDDAPEILRSIKDGFMTCTVAMEWYVTGYDACTLAKTIMEGGSVEYENDAGAKVLFAEDIDAWVKEKGIDMDE